jgi:osmotically-inducible protein OsmY
MRSGDEVEGYDTAQMVRDALAYTGGINEANIEVHYGDGVVTLSGIAFSDAERRLAEDVASHVPGVRRVVNEIMVVKAGGA